MDKLKEVIRIWLWKVLATPIMERIEKGMAYHTQVVERRLLTEINRLDRDIEHRVNDLRNEVVLHGSGNLRETQLVLNELRRHANLQEYEAVHFASEKMVLDQDFWKLSTDRQRKEKIADWVRIYCSKNNWHIPSQERLDDLIAAKLDQITHRKVGPTQ